MFRWAALKEALLENRSKLGEAQSLQQFSRDADEMDIWIGEKMQMALEESYKDPTNIQSKHQKHQVCIYIYIYYIFILCIYIK